MSFKDHFSSHAKNYAKYRPTYPQSLYDGIFNHIQNFDLAWDCGTGNGQVAIELAKKFEKVIATDASKQQIDHAIPHLKVEYHVSKSENIFLPDNSLDLLTVGQALHWFHFDKFFDEVKRVVKPGGIFTCWSYKYLTINKDLDEVLYKFFDLIEDYWPPERDHVAAEYKSIPFSKDFEALDFPSIFIERDMTAEETLGYLRTWSGVKNYKLKHNGEDPLDIIQPEFYKNWGNINHTKVIKHPLITKLFRIS